MWSGVSGRSGKRTPVALARALAIAGADRVDRTFALRLGAERADRVVGVGEIDLAPRHVGKGGNAIVAQRRVHHGAVLIEHHVLVERPAEAHGDGAVDLAAALHRIDQSADVGGVHALQ